ncbi:hypothetical protein EV193_105139 [Herbihabitans rhizosphaerae]|uniref:Uncharacterized protein n=1 Tax=Herbihabitans rhizosphaerae TaxID=1872711 RepID=A0A4Q7KPG7_9PSEU|nr:hypothetical protein [Herbihabitans rhizosphaerae]RZS37581.1 hypothetical protein EV193_105139 [Herbihabitans rhizosphaerae]
MARVFHGITDGPAPDAIVVNHGELDPWTSYFTDWWILAAVGAACGAADGKRGTVFRVPWDQVDAIFEQPERAQLRLRGAGSIDRCPGLAYARDKGAVSVTGSVEEPDFESPVGPAELRDAAARHASDIPWKTGD